MSFTINSKRMKINCTSVFQDPISFNVRILEKNSIKIDRLRSKGMTESLAKMTQSEVQKEY